MKIGIDARLIDETGVGRYIRNLVYFLGEIDNENQYVIFLRKKTYASFTLPNSRWEKRLADVPWHSFREQFVMPWIFLRERLDLLHIPYFNIPVFYPGKFIVTIHDLTILHFDTGKASTLPLPLYKLRRFGYNIALLVGLHRAENIITVSETTKNEVIDHFHINPNKITVTYEGISNNVTRNKRHETSQTRLIHGPYFLYVGNAYPHKNLEMLLRAFKKFTVHSSQFTAKLVLVGRDDYFYKRLRATVKEMQISDRVNFFGEATEEELQNLYKNTIALVFPSLMEGFGLPGLEAMAAGVPVVCSDIPVFHEIYKDAALYFDLKSDVDIVKKLKDITHEQVRKKYIQQGFIQVSKYSWQKLAGKTLSVYNQDRE